MPGGLTRRQSGVLAFALSLAGITPALAQTPPSSFSETPRWVGHFTVLAGNATLGALTGGILQKLRGGSFKDGFARGALGGAVMYAGKRVVVERFWGAGFLGREIDAVGVSVVRNASDGRPSLSRLFLPVGPLPVRANVDLSHGLRVQPQLDLTAAGWLVYGLYQPGLALDLGQSLSGGVAVFQAQRGRVVELGAEPLGGFAVARSVFLSDSLALRDAVPDWGAVAAHERVHVLQQDFVLSAWSQPAADRALQWVPGGRALSRFVAVDALDWLVGTVSFLVSRSSDSDRFPTEREAYFLTGR